MHPDFKDQENDISLTVHVRGRAQATAVAQGPFTLAAGAAKRDFRASGAIIELEFSGTNYARFGKPVFDAVATGRR